MSALTVIGVSVLAQVCVAGVASTLPAASFARTYKRPCSPSIGRPERHGSQPCGFGPAHWYVTPASSEAKTNVAGSSWASGAGPLTTCVFGRRVSLVHSQRIGTASRRPVSSVARVSKVWAARG